LANVAEHKREVATTAKASLPILPKTRVPESTLEIPDGQKIRSQDRVNRGFRAGACRWPSACRPLQTARGAGGGLLQAPGESADAFRARAHAAIRKP
jgi:hypothetical protein